MFSGRVQKIVTTCASIASVSFNKYFIEETEKSYKERLKYLEDNSIDIEDFKSLEVHIAKMRDKYFKAHFDARIFNIEEDIKYMPFVWRYLDCHKNATQMVARSEFSNKALSNKHTNDMIDMLKSEKGIDFYSLPERYIDGVCAIKKETLLYEGTERECTRNKWTLTPARQLIESFVNENEDIYSSYSRINLRKESTP